MVYDGDGQLFAGAWDWKFLPHKQPAACTKGLVALYTESHTKVNRLHVDQFSGAVTP